MANNNGKAGSYIHALITTHLNGQDNVVGIFKITGCLAIQTELQNEDKIIDIGEGNKVASDYDNTSIVKLIQNNIKKVLRNAPKSGLEIIVSNYTPNKSDTEATLDIIFKNVYMTYETTRRDLKVDNATITGFNSGIDDTKDNSYIWYIVGGVIGGILIICIIVFIIISSKRQSEFNKSLKKLSARQSVPRLGNSSGPNQPKQIGMSSNRNNPNMMNNQRQTPGSGPKPPVPQARAGAGAQRPGMNKPSGPMPPRVEVNGPPKSLAPKRR